MATRSRPEDRRLLIIDAARAAFGQYGYTATTTASIALRAGVSEATVYRDFGTKEALFDAAVLTPFTEFTTRHLTEWRHRDPGSLPAVDEAALLLNRLIELFNEERAVVLPLLAAYHFDGASAKLRKRLEGAMHGLIALVESRMVGEAKTRGYDGFDIAPLARIIVGVCFSLVTFPELFDISKIPRSRIVQEMSRLTVHGVEFRRAGFTPGIASASMNFEPTTMHGSRISRAHPSRVDDETWCSLTPIFASARSPSLRGRRPVDDRSALEGILDVLNSGRPWRELPSDRHGISGVTCWRRLKAWQNNGIWTEITDVLHRHGIDTPSVRHL